MKYRQHMKNDKESVIVIICLVVRQKQPPEVFCKKGVLRNFLKFIEKHLCQSLFFNKIGPGSLLKKR